MNIDFLCPWIKSCILDLPDQKRYWNSIVCKNFILHQGPLHDDTAPGTVATTPLVRIGQFTATTPNGELIGIVNDSDNLIAARFSLQAIQKYELENARRLTYETTNRLFVINHAELRLVRDDEKQLFSKAYNSVYRDWKRGVTTVYLYITSLLVFLRDRHTISGVYENRIRYIYEDAQYRDKFGSVPLNEGIFYDLDDPNNGFLSE